MVNKKFKWADKRHFINTSCKVIREKHNQKFVTKKLISFLHKLYEWEEENIDIFNSDGYLLPTSLLVKGCKKADTSDQLFEVINRAQNNLLNNNSTAYQFNQGAPIMVSIGNGEAVEMDYKDWRELVAETKARKPNDELLESLYGKPGVYLLYSKHKELLYIGKSRNLASRVYSSASERKATFLRYIFTKTEADCHIVEPYLVTMLNPPFNSDFKSIDLPSFEIPVPDMSDFIDLTRLSEGETI